MMRPMISITALLLSGSLAVAGPKRECLERSQRSVCKVLVQRDGKEGVGSGFLCQDTKTIVTALHVVAGAETITVTFTLEDSTITTSGKIDKNLKAYDLALVRLNKAIDAEPLKIVSDRVHAGAELTTIGYPRGSLVKLDTPSIVRQLNSYAPLGDIVPADMRHKLPTLPVLGWKSEVLNLTGALQPGNSGGPLLDEKCAVVAVLSGGIPQGSGYLNWGIPIEKIQELLASTEKPIKWVEGESNFFSQSMPTPEVADAEPIESTWGNFYLIGTRALSQMRFGIETWVKDDPLGLEQLIVWATTCGVPAQELLNLRYDIYQEPASGATVVVPSGLRLEFKDQLLQATTSQGRLTLKAGVFKSNGPSSALGDSVQFEQKTCEGAAFFQFDPRLTYIHPGNPMLAVPRVFPDGRWVVRKGAALRSNAYVAMPDRFVFETLSGRATSFLGVAAYSRAIPSERQWMGDTAFMRDWVAMVLAVHCSGFSWSIQPAPAAIQNPSKIPARR